MPQPNDSIKLSSSAAAEIKNNPSPLNNSLTSNTRTTTGVTTPSPKLSETMSSQHQHQSSSSHSKFSILHFLSRRSSSRRKRSQQTVQTVESDLDASAALHEAEAAAGLQDIASSQQMLPDHSETVTDGGDDDLNSAGIPRNVLLLNHSSNHQQSSSSSQHQRPLSSSNTGEDALTESHYDSDDDEDLWRDTVHDLSPEGVVGSSLSCSAAPVASKSCHRAHVLKVAAERCYSDAYKHSLEASEFMDREHTEDFKQSLEEALETANQGLELLDELASMNNNNESQQDDVDDVNSILETTSAAATTTTQQQILVEANSSVDTLTDSLKWKLIQLKAQVLGRLGLYQESLRDHEKLLQLILKQGDLRTLPLNALSKASNLQYACGRLCVYSKDYARAIEFYQFELETTKLLLSRTQLHSQTTQLQPQDMAQKQQGSSSLQVSQQVVSVLALSRIHHELARLHKVARGDGPSALRQYQMALAVELDVYSSLQQVCQTCPSCSLIQACVQSNCNSSSKKKGSSKKNKNKVLPTPTCSHRTDLLETMQQIRDTKRAMGRIHFEQGDLDKAVRVSL